MPTDHLKLNKEAFLRQYRFSSDDFMRTELDWSFLETVFALQHANQKELQTTAEYISQRLQQVPAIHSLKIRIKHPEHLIAKIIRKRLDDPTREITIKNYGDTITDLIGIKALHLLKNQWRPIHEFVTETWELAEAPVAYFREGDPDYLIKDFREHGCDVQKHDFGYRSVHYLIKSLPSRLLRIAELQVRTLFEEGWSEIDHQVRYPRITEDPHLTQFLTIFNRLAGSADEMGTYIQALSSHLAEQTEKLTKKENELERMEQELKMAISKLNLSQKEKKALDTQIEQLRRSSQTITMAPLGLSSWGQPLSFLGTRDISQTFLTGLNPEAKLSDIIQMKTCPKCQNRFTEVSAFDNNDKCSSCRNIQP